MILLGSSLYTRTYLKCQPIFHNSGKMFMYAVIKLVVSGPLDIYLVLLLDEYFSYYSLLIATPSYILVVGS
jgi:hypothetical protein